jgi:hypothetical protein
MASCTFAPKKGTDLFYEIKKEVGYDKAWEVIGILNNSKFKEDFKDSLTFNSEGFPSFEETMKNPYIQEVLGIDNTRKILQKDFKELEDTFDNYKMALHQAKEFNLGEHSEKFTAVVKNENGKLRVTILPRTETAIEEFNNQFASTMLNEKLERILSPIGVSYGMLSEAEQLAGRIGSVDFSVVKRMAEDSISMIHVANNMEGVNALSEEYTHLIVAAFRDTPLMQRLINSLTYHPDIIQEILGDEYDDNLTYHQGNMEIMAEEAVGKLLRDHFMREVAGTGYLVQRLKSYIYSKFKDIDTNEIAQAMIDSENALSQLAKDILSGKEKVDLSQVKERNLQLNALSERIERNMKILEEAMITEHKRGILSEDEQIPKRLNYLQNAMNQGDEKFTITAIAKYAYEAVGALIGANTLISRPESDPNKKMKNIRSAKITLDSYGKFVHALNLLIAEEEHLSKDPNVEPDLRSMLIGTFNVTDKDGNIVEVDLGNSLRALNNLVNQIGAVVSKEAIDAYAEFLKPILGERVAYELGKKAGTSVAVKDLLESADSDISFFDMWVDSMADSKDVILQSFDTIIKKAKDAAQADAIEDINRIQRLYRKAKEKGITNFEFAFERDRNGNKTGYYISEVNERQWEADRLKMEEDLSAKYGDNPTGAERDAKNAERKAWHSTHSLLANDQYVVNPDVYHNSDYDTLTSDEKAILEEFKAIKDELDAVLPEKDVAENKAIQIRKSVSMRFLESLSSPSTMLDNLKNHLADELLDREDDNQLFGENTRQSLTDFSGREHRVLPVLYTHMLRNPNEISTDIFGSLIAYAAMARKYEQLNKIVDSIEVGRMVMEERDKRVQETRGDSGLVEGLRTGRGPISQKIFKRQGTNMMQKLEEFLDAQLYGRTQKDEGVKTIFGFNFNKAKVGNKILSIASVAQLAYNGLAQLASAAQGIAMINIEAAAGEYFNAKQLAAADAEYISLMGKFIAELGSPMPSNKLALFDRAINFKGDFFKNAKQADMRKLMQRLLGKQFGFLGQEAGDHWLYNRVAIAMAKARIVKVNGVEMSLWDAIEYREEDMYLGLPEGTINATTGKEITLQSFGREIQEVNKELFGLYNDEDSMAANRYIMGRALIQYRKYMRPLWNKRFGGHRKSNVTGRDYEGFYVTAGKVFLEMATRKRALFDFSSNLTDHQKKNLIRAVFEVVQFGAVSLLATMLDAPDDWEEGGRALALANYIAKRLKRELGMFVPSTTMFSEWYATVQAPFAALNVIKFAGDFMGHVMFPPSWIEELKNGRYKGMTHLEKAAYMLPIPILSYYRQYDKMWNRLDEMADYYTRSR